MHMQSISFRKKHCKAVSDIGILCFQFAFVVKKKKTGGGREKERKKKRILHTINHPLHRHERPLCVFLAVTGKLFIFTS